MVSSTFGSVPGVLRNAAAAHGLRQPRKDLGAPVSRDRCYILMVRSCLAVKAAQQDFNKFATDLISGLNMPECHDWTLG